MNIALLASTAISLASSLSVAAPAPARAHPEDPVRTYVLPIQGIMGLDFDGAMVDSFKKDLAEAKPSLVVIEIDSARFAGDKDAVKFDPRREMSEVMMLRDATAALHDAIGSTPTAVLVRQAVGVEGFAALAWPAVYMAPSARIGVPMSEAVGAAAGDADVKAKMMSAWKGIGKGIAEMGNHEAQSDALLAAGSAGGLDAAAATTAKMAVGTANDVQDVALKLGHRSATIVGHGKELADAAAAEWRTQYKAAEEQLAAFQQPVDGPAELADRRKLLASVRKSMQSSPRLATALEWRFGFTVEQADQLLEKLDAQIAAMSAVKPQWVEMGGGQVVMLPFEGPIGDAVTASAVEAAGKLADARGPGQVIVLEFDSPGGLVTELFKLSDAIRALRERHRVVAWVREAISGAAVCAMLCDEIYFRPQGALGAAMMIGKDSVYGEPFDRFRDEIGTMIEKSGRSRLPFDAMVRAKAILTYSKDPATGKVMFHDTVTGLPGEVVLSDDKDNLTLNARNALDCGFSKGTAASTAELAPMIGMQRKSAP